MQSLAGATLLGPVDPGEQLTVTVLVRRREELPEIADASARLTREELAGRYGADPADVAKVENFVRDNGLDVGEVDIAARTVSLSGGAAAFAQAFGVELLSNVLEGPGVISSEGERYPALDDRQLSFLIAELERVKPLRQAAEDKPPAGYELTSLRSPSTATCCSPSTCPQPPPRSPSRSSKRPANHPRATRSSSTSRRGGSSEGPTVSTPAEQSIENQAFGDRHRGARGVGSATVRRPAQNRPSLAAGNRRAVCAAAHAMPPSGEDLAGAADRLRARADRLREN
ncbi:MAG: protease pro-enzyme activation domain-containing protein [Solirubrobacteraceae bacterium]